MKHKRQLVELADALQHYAGAERIGEALGYSGQHIRNILHGQGRPSRDCTLDDFLASLPDALRLEVEEWRQRRRIV